MNPSLPDTLRAAARTLAATPIASLFGRDRERVERLTWTWEGFRVDLSKERITREAMAGLCAHAEDAGLARWIAALLAGEKVNVSEGRPVLHPALRESLLPLWQAGELAVIHGLGYPQPNLSHFRSIEIWDTASASNQTLSEGWIAGAALDTHFRYPMPPDHPLWRMPNVIMTPHISGSDKGPHFLDRMGEIVEHNVAAYLSGQTLWNEIPRAAL